MIDLRKLHHFVVLAQVGSYRLAAQELHISQPALSRSIQSLEHCFGESLLDRGRTGAFPTPFGVRLLERAEALLRDAEGIERDLRPNTDQPLGTVRFGIGPTTGSLWLSGLLRELLATNAEVSVSVVVGSSRTMARSLFDREIDFFVGRYDPQVEHDRVHAEPLVRVPPAFLTRPGHPLAGAENVELSDLAGYPRLAGSAWNETVTQFAPPRFRRVLRATVEIDNTELLVSVAALSDAILIGAPGVGRGELVPLAIDSPHLDGPTSQIGLFTLAGRTLPASAVMVADHLRRAARRERWSPDTDRGTG